MKAMVMAAGLGKRLRPLTYEIPKPLVPVANRPIMEHILLRLARDGFGEVIANLHWFPETIRESFGDGAALGVELTYSQEERLLGTAGGVRNVREYFGSEPFLVMAGDALTDVDLAELAGAHAASDRIATLAVKPVTNTTEYGVVVTGSDGLVEGFQEKPEPAEALSDLANCMIYVLEPEIFDHFPDAEEVDFALDVFPALLDRGVPFGVHVTDSYWNDVGSLPEYLQGNLDVLTGAVDVEPAGELVDSAAAAGLGPDVELEGPVLLGEGARIGEGARLDGPLVIGPGARVGAGARLRESVLLPGAEVPADGLLAGAIAGNANALAGIVAASRPST
ncbi:MAG: mannose-phosphate guanylyltransferase / phosphomannomutase [Solirubrobacterales bacterium]|jgi:mannose-1-phosphate guanylyltransferase/mannose-1-phosphate guanylyltransferase/phosphomannomutase|nr:mannose-phosphate guanylyltransferase / phosphomannomutase [Solirubrobacterales bacterium]